MTLAGILEARLRRSEQLAAKYPFATQILGLYQRVASFQRALCQDVPQAWRGQGGTTPRESIRSELNLVSLLPHFSAFLTLVKEHAPKPLAEAATALDMEDSSAWIAVLADHWEFGGRRTEQVEDARREFLCRGFLQPFAEMNRQTRDTPVQTIASRTCPFCGARPVAGVLRPEGEGGKRFLLCSFCGHEWEFRRILCAGCGEAREESLPVFAAEQFPHIRVEGCDTCRRCLRTIDLTKDGHAVPMIDDLAAIPLTLWAQEHGYARIEPNLLGT